MYKDILKAKKMSGLSWDKLAEDLPITGDSLRISFSRQTTDVEFIGEIVKKIRAKLKGTKHEKLPLPSFSTKEVVDVDSENNEENNEHKKREQKPSQQEIDDFIKFLINEKESYKDNKYYQLFETSIRKYEHKKAVIEVLKELMANEK